MSMQCGLGQILHAGSPRWLSSRKSTDHRLFGSRRPQPMRTSSFHISTPRISCLISQPRRTRRPAEIRFMDAPSKHLIPERLTLPTARPHKVDDMAWPLAAVATTVSAWCNPCRALELPVTQQLAPESNTQSGSLFCGAIGVLVLELLLVAAMTALLISGGGLADGHMKRSGERKKKRTVRACRHAADYNKLITGRSKDKIASFFIRCFEFSDNL